MTSLNALHAYKPGLKTFVIAAVLLTAAGCRTNPVTGKSQMIFFSTEDELALGDSYHPNLVMMYDGEYLDPELKLYLGTIVNRLRAVSHRRDMRVDFTVLNTSVFNAFAIPGHVYCTRGFLAQLQNEAQFAAVMAHELGHVNALHTAKQMTNQILIAAGLAVVQESLGQGGSARGVMLAGEVSLALLGLSYSREQEHQADRVGTYYMALAGWDPRQSIAMQRLLAGLSSHQETIIDKYLSTHPPAAERIMEINAVIAEKGLLDKDYIQGDGIFEERWLRRTAEVRKVNEAFKPYDKGSELLRKGRYNEALAAAEEALRNRKNQAPFHRLKGDALLMLGRLSEARASYTRALDVDRRYVPANVGLGQVALNENKLTEAEMQFAAAVRGFPSSPLANFGLGVSRLRQGRFQDAIQPFEAAAGGAPEDALVWYLLAVCYDNTGQTTKAYLAYRQSLKNGLEGEPQTHAQQRVSALQSLVESEQQQQRGK
jgi:predicted Zn-dependent protease